MPIAVEVYVTAPFNPQALIVVHIGFNDPSFNHDLADRNIKLSDNPAEFVKTLLSLVGDDVVSTVINSNRATILTLATLVGNGLE